MQTDYVITWVDGQDARHKAARKFYLEKEKKQAGGHFPNHEEARHGFEKTTKIRFQDNGELYYNIASVLLYAPFMRRIYIVTDGQTPPLLKSFAEEGKCKADFLKIVSHNDIFKPDAALPDLQAARPCFNSISIETVLWRIPDLAEHFIYSNDDFFFNAPAAPEYFFKSNIPVIHGKWKNALKMRLNCFLKSCFGKKHSRQSKASYTASIWKAAALAGGFNYKFFTIGHYPHPLRKSVFADFFTRCPDILNKQLECRFRSLQQFDPVSLANHLEIKRGAVPAGKVDITYLDKIKSPEYYAAFLNSIRAEKAPFGCIQDMGLYPPEIQAGLHKTLTEKFKSVLPETIRRYLLTPQRQIQANVKAI